MPHLHNPDNVPVSVPELGRDIPAGGTVDVDEKHAKLFADHPVLKVRRSKSDKES